MKIRQERPKYANPQTISTAYRYPASVPAMSLIAICLGLNEAADWFRMAIHSHRGYLIVRTRSGILLCFIYSCSFHLTLRILENAHGITYYNEKAAWKRDNPAASYKRSNSQPIF